MSYENFEDDVVQEGAGVNEVVGHSEASLSGLESSTNKSVSVEHHPKQASIESETVYSGGFEDKYWREIDGKKQFEADIAGSQNLEALIATIEEWEGVPYNEVLHDFMSPEDFRKELKKLTENINETALEHGIKMMPVISIVKDKLHEFFITPRPLPRQEAREYVKKETKPIIASPIPKKKSFFSSFLNIFRRK